MKQTRNEKLEETTPDKVAKEVYVALEGLASFERHRFGHWEVAVDFLLIELARATDAGLWDDRGGGLVAKVTLYNNDENGRRVAERSFVDVANLTVSKTVEMYAEERAWKDDIRAEFTLRPNNTRYLDSRH